MKAQEDLLRLMELGVLQKILYHEKDENIPDFKFKKINSFSRITIHVGAGGIVLASLAIIVLKYPGSIWNWLNINPTEAVKTIVNITALTAPTVGAYRSILHFIINSLKCHLNHDA